MIATLADPSQPTLADRDLPVLFVLARAYHQRAAIGINVAYVRLICSMRRMRVE